MRPESRLRRRPHGVDDATVAAVGKLSEALYAPFVEHERTVRDALCAGERHVYESELKERRRTAGLRHHELAPEARSRRLPQD